MIQLCSWASRVPIHWFIDKKGVLLVGHLRAALEQNYVMCGKEVAHGAQSPWVWG